MVPQVGMIPSGMIDLLALEQCRGPKEDRIRYGQRYAIVVS